jgi:hypothetical protein
MTSRRRHEPTQPGNPREITIKQHVHSRWCIDKFANADGQVAVLRRGSSTPFTTTPTNAVFCAQRAWDENLEHGLYAKVERDFHAVVTAVLSGNSVPNHEAVTAYIAIWQVRSNFSKEPPPDFTLVGINSSSLTKDQEEVIEKKGGAFARGATIPGRFATFVPSIRAYDQTLNDLAGLTWGVIRASHGATFLCPDSPQRQLYIPISRQCALVAGHQDCEVGMVTTSALNRDAARGALYVFGHVDDIEAFDPGGP